MNDVSSSPTVLVPRDSATASSTVTIVNVPHQERTVRTGTGAFSKKVEAAVYSHIRAVRGLGRTTINTAEIAAALNLPRVIVEQAITGLAKKGVKIPL